MTNNLKDALRTVQGNKQGSASNTSSATEQQRAKKAAAAATRPPSRENSEQLGVWVSKAGKKQLKMMCLEHETTQQAFLIEAINLLFAKYNKAEIAAPEID